jgi:hypothetical protein
LRQVLLMGGLKPAPAGGRFRRSPLWPRRSGPSCWSAPLPRASSTCAPALPAATGGCGADLAAGITAVAPITSRSRRSSSPARLIPPSFCRPAVETSRGVMPIQDRAGLGERPNVHRALGRGGRGLTNYCKKGISHGDMVICFFDAEVKAELDALPVEIRKFRAHRTAGARGRALAGARALLQAY